MPTSVSLGVATKKIGQEITVRELLRRADEGLYLAKRKGRNRLEFSDQ